jgi:integrase
VFERDEPLGNLLFPSPKLSGNEGLITDTRKMLDAIGGRVGWKLGEIRTRIFRHTYCAARLQTLDRGAPVTPWTVAREMGHGGTRLVERVYGHLGEVRHRSEVVEFRVEQHEEKLGIALQPSH